MIRNLFNTLFTTLLLAAIPMAAQAQPCLQWLLSNGASVQAPDLSPNDPQIWNDAAFNDPITPGSYDLPDGTVPSILLRNNCGGNFTLTYVLRLDLDGNGSRETVITPDNQLPDGQLWIDNANAPNYVGTTSAFFDARPVPASGKFRWGLYTSVQADTILVRLGWDTPSNPGVFIDASLPYGTHELQLTASNGTENQTVTYAIEVDDQKKPTIVCLNGLSVNIMPTGNIPIWASDFLQYTEDNYSTVPNLDLAVERADSTNGTFPTNPDGSPINNVVFTCADIGQPIMVQLWSRDQYNNADYCTTFIQVQDNNNVCDPALSFLYTPAPNCADENGLQAKVVGGVWPLQYEWNNGATTSYLSNISNGIYIVTVTDGNGVTLVDTYVVTDEPMGCGVLSGYVAKDNNANCLYNASNDLPLQNWPVRFDDANGFTYYTHTDANGYFQKRLPPGDYLVTTVFDTSIWAACPPMPVMQLGAGDTLIADLLLQAEYDCAAINVEVQIPYVYSCTENGCYVQYCNKGTENATDAYVDMAFDDYTAFISATVPHTALGGNMYRFHLGLVPVSVCGAFNVVTFLSCSSIPGQTHCTQATAYPPGDCFPPNGLWSGASLELTASCDGDSLRFEIKNVGQSDMTQSVEYIVIEDLVMMHKGDVGLLATGASMQVALPYNGATWRMEVEQVAYHPGASKPALSIESCNGNVFTTGIVSQFFLNEANPWEDTECAENINTFLNTGKSAFPVGYGPEHSISAGTVINYDIRFLNTTSDTINTVIVRDTLSPWLDPATLVIFGGGFLPYSFSFEGIGPNLKFTFEDINLAPVAPSDPYSSLGWLSFSVQPKAGVPVGTQILNTAHISFDNATSMPTNTVWHTIESNFVQSTINQAGGPTAQVLAFEVSPNPATDMLMLQNAIMPRPDSRYVVVDVYGREVITTRHWAEQQAIPVAQLAAGVYAVQYWCGGTMMGVRKVVR